VQFDGDLYYEGRSKTDAESRGPGWLRTAFGKGYFRKVLAVDFASGDAPKLLRDGDLVALNAFESLMFINLGDNPSITDAGLQHLAGLNSLRSLCLHRTSVTGPGIEHLPDSVRQLDLQFAPLDDGVIRHLKSLPNLSSLLIGNTAITDVGLADLSTIRTLRRLVLDHTDITDAGLRHLESLTNLEGLDVLCTNVTGSGVARLEKAIPRCRVYPPSERLNAIPLDIALWPAGYQPTVDEIVAKVKELGGEAELDPTAFEPSIGALNLFASSISDECLLGLLEHLPELKELDLGQTLVSDYLIQGLSRSPKLESLSLHESRLTDAGLVHIGKLTWLRSLSLARTRISDAGLDHLAGLKNLKTLSVGYTRVTDKGFQRLRQMLPQCNVY